MENQSKQKKKKKAWKWIWRPMIFRGSSKSEKWKQNYGEFRIRKTLKSLIVSRGRIIREGNIHDSLKEENFEIKITIIVGINYITIIIIIYYYNYCYNPGIIKCLFVCCYLRKNCICVPTVKPYWERKILERERRERESQSLLTNELRSRNRHLSTTPLFLMCAPGGSGSLRHAS